ncbi:MAG TPA: metal-dependent hydrolase [Pyrinomonadaceae bacterium]|jgi:inner membrane protein|nr:metal-dependent hydrolase [Pyrinomonadaceae bacterium]
MDNLTHSLIGLAAAKAGLEKLSPGATTLCLLAANSPDADIVVLIFGGRWEFLQHHRGITHSIVGALALAIALPVIFWLGDWLLAKVRHRSSRLRFRGLLLASLLVTATHPAMDWTNNYGMRFLLPWSGRWFYGDFIFIIDPFIWMMLGGAVFLIASKTRKQVCAWIAIALITSYIVLVGISGSGTAASRFGLRLFWIVSLVALVILYRQKIGKLAGAKISVAALAIVIIYCAGLAGTHLLALRGAKIQATSIATRNSENVIRVAAMPTLANPNEWVCVMETDRATYKFDLSLVNSPPGEANPPSSANIIRYAKPVGAAAEIVANAARDRRSEIFLGFARFPVMRVVGEDCVTQTLVQFADLRYTEPGKGRGTFSLDVPVECPVPSDGK